MLVLGRAGLGRRRCGDALDEGSFSVASKDKGGKSEKKEPKKNLKEKRAAKKAKKK